MKENLGLKFSFVLGGGILFWALFGMVFIVYGFFPVGTKDQNQYIFLVAFPFLYFFLMNYILAKFFKDRNWKDWAINSALILLGEGVAVGLVIGAVKFLGAILGR